MFSYRNEDRLLSLCCVDDALLALLPGRLVVWSRSGRRVCRELDAGDASEVMEWAGRWILISRDRVWMAGSSGDILRRTPLSVQIAYGDVLVVVDEESVTVVGEEVWRVRLVERNGVCCCGVARGGDVFLAFENGKIFRILQSAMERIHGAEQMSMECVAFLKEPVASVDVCGERLVAALFSRKIVAVDLRSGDVAFTELLHDIRHSFVWRGMVVADDSASNVVLLNMDLRIVCIAGFAEDICSVAGDGHALLVGFRNGVVKECGEESLHAIAVNR